jgi:predicted acetyltransferase
MIGMVYTLPQYRHLGLASNLLDTIGNKLKKEGTDFAVLWTKINDFYKRLGWYQQDNGIFGEFSKPTTTKVIKSNNLIESVQLKTADFNSLESIRMQYLDVRILRTGLDYQVIPIPTNSVDLYLFELHNKCSGYALIGRLSETGYLYEVVGDPGSYEGLWTSISSNYDNLYINSSLDSEFTKWLGDVTNFNWKLQNLTMWLKLSENANRLLKLETYIPFFDRI